MTQATINGKRVALTIEQKARLLTVFDNHPDLAANELAVTSGSIRNVAYVVRHDGRHVQDCSCDAWLPRCSHAIAAEWFLEAKNRAGYAGAFDPGMVA
jgi:aerobic-type carbon monoxide dehydrogenase small subunit (CoxS/CutS family)